MKAMKLWSSILVMCVAMIALASCSSESNDGDWAPMKWKAEVNVHKTNGTYNVAAAGETIIFSCRNYSGFWFTGTTVDGEAIYPSNTDETDHLLIDNDYLHAEIHDNKMTVAFKANNSSQARNITIGVTAGDIFYTFRFRQYAHGSVEIP